MPQMVSASADPKGFTVASERIAFKFGAKKARMEGREEVGIDFISIIAALLTTLLPTFLDLCKKNARSLVESARRPNIFEQLRFRTQAISFLRRKANFRLAEASGVTEELLEFGKSEEFTEEDAADYLAEGQ